MNNLITLRGEEFTNEELANIEEKALPIIKDLADKTKQMKALDTYLKKAKKELEKVMDEYDVKSYDSPYINFIRIAKGQDKTTIDLDALQKKEPELYADLLTDYPKTVKGKAASVRFTVK